MAERTKGLQNLQRQLDAAFPDRHRPDGWIGDAAHKGSASSHNADDTAGSKPAWDRDPDNLAEVRALDVDARLGAARPRDLVDHLRQLPDLGLVVRYLIFDGFIYHSRVDFAPQRFAGDNQHTGHIHVEGAWSQAGDLNTTYDFRLQEVPVSMTEADKEWHRRELRQLLTSDADPTGRVYSLGGMVTTIERRTSAHTAELIALRETITELTSVITALTKAVTGGPGDQGTRSVPSDSR